MEEKRLNREERRTLLGLARSAIAKKLKLDHQAVEVKSTPGLSSKSGAFVSLHRRGSLRGCIGTFSSETPLSNTVEDMARAAAFDDPRFPPMSEEELPEVNLEISVLTPMRRVQSIEEIEVGRHGIYIAQGAYRGVLLPQVATENNWNRDTFLKHTCLKAGLKEDCWRDEKTEIHIFSAEVFGEDDIEKSG